MSKKYRAVIFDVDGTLLDTTEGIAAAVEYTIAQAGLGKLTDREIRTFIGPPIQESFQRIYGIEGAKLQELATIFRNRYKDHELLKAKPYEGIYEVLNSLRVSGMQLAVATYKRQDYAETLLKHFKFDRYTKVIYGADHENQLKKADIIQKCLLDMAVEAAQTVMIGDSSYDAVGAAQAGMDFIGVTYGFGFRSQDEIMQYMAAGGADKPIELLDYLI